MLKIICIQCLNDSYKNVSRTSSPLGKIVIFLYTGIIIQVLDFDNWHPLNKVSTTLDGYIKILQILFHNHYLLRKINKTRPITVK